MAIKRLHYYNQQFLVEADFTDEQRYHLDMRRRVSRVLHTPGIAEGLEVQRTGSRQVTVKAGTAIDGNGREIVLEADQIVDLSNLSTFPPSTTVFVRIAYQEAQTDPSTATGAQGNTRFTEAPLVQASTTAGPTDSVPLARFDKTAGGDVPVSPLGDLIDGGVRQSASAKIAPGAIAEVNLAAALAAKINTPAGIASVDGVSNPGGNVDLVGANAIQLTPSNAARTITIGETHSSRVDNPHGTTAAQVSALALSGGTLTGTLQVNGNLGVNIAPATRLHVSGASPAVRIADGTQAAGRVLVSDASGNATWRDNSRYFVSGSLNNASVNTSTVALRIGDYLTFVKASAESQIEVTLNTRATSGVFAGASGVIFQVRIDNNPTAMANEAAITTSNVIEYIGIFSVFQGLAAGNHTVSVWVRTNAGTSSAVLLDPGGWGGRIVVKETF